MYVTDAPCPICYYSLIFNPYRLSALAMSSSLHWKTCEPSLSPYTPRSLRLNHYRYFVTELLGTDLHRLLTSRPLEKQFVQYFLYQILVSDDVVTCSSVLSHLAWSKICPLRGSRAPRSRESFVLFPSVVIFQYKNLQKPSNILVNENCDLKVRRFHEYVIT
jgi:hypothetical protein